MEVFKIQAPMTRLNTLFLRVQNLGCYQGFDVKKSTILIFLHSITNFQYWEVRRPKVSRGSGKYRASNGRCKLQHP